MLQDLIAFITPSMRIATRAGLAGRVSPSPKDQRAAKAKSVSLEQLSMSQARSSPNRLGAVAASSKADHRNSLQPIDEVVLGIPSLANGNKS